jgi:hypothetical protein
MCPALALVVIGAPRALGALGLIPSGGTPALREYCARGCIWIAGS